MKILVLGIGGAVSKYFIDYLGSIDYPMELVRGVYRQRPLNDTRIQQDQIDLSSEGIRFGILLNEYRPDLIINFASDAVVDDSITGPAGVLYNNTCLMANLLGLVKEVNPKSRIVHISTAEVYGNTTNPIVETAPYNPENPYAISKVTQEQLIDYYIKAYGLSILTFRSFSYVNSLRSDLVLTAFVDRCLETLAGRTTKVCMGNLSSIRTWMDVRDMVRLYWKGINLCQYGEKYNVGLEPSDPTVVPSIQKVCDLIAKKMSIPASVIVPHTTTKLRPVDVKIQMPSMKKFESIVSDNERISLDNSLNYLIEQRGKMYV